MNRYLAVGGLALAGLMLSACAGGPLVDRAELGQSRTGAVEAPARRVAHAPRPRRESRQAQRPERARVAGPADTAFASEAPAPVETTGSIGSHRANQHRPMPFVGTPEWQQLQAEEAERERRIQRAMQNICRGC